MSCGQSYLCSSRLPIVDYPLCFVIYYSMFSEMSPMLPMDLDYTILTTLCVLSNVYLLQSVQRVEANVVNNLRLSILGYPLDFT